MDGSGRDGASGGGVTHVANPRRRRRGDDDDYDRIAATADADISGHVFLGGAIDTRESVPLCLNHDAAHLIGEVYALYYSADRLHCWAETDDPDAAGYSFFSLAGRALERQPDGNLWRVSKARLTEVSLVRTPCNRHCRVIERTARDPCHEYVKVRRHLDDLMHRRISLLPRIRECARRA
jgi:hypothetical protein